MATVVRVKRPCDDEPIEAFILNCKRRKVSEEENTNPLSIAVFKFAGTLEKEEDLVSHFDSKHAEESKKLKNYLKKHKVSIEDKLRAAHKETSKRNRFKIVNRFRSQTENSTDSNKVDLECLDKSVTVLDLEKDLEVESGDKPNSDERNFQKYVYDLYYSHPDECKDEEMEDYLSVHPICDYLSMDSLAVNDDTIDDTGSEDSNAENDWRNDYPDEVDVESINEEDMAHAMKHVGLDDDLLSTDEENDFLYGNDDNDDGETETPDESDVMRYGKRYAMFKAKYTKVLDSDSEHDVDY